MHSIERLFSLFLKFPGIGRRQARRFVYFLLAASPEYAEELQREIAALRNNIRQCVLCFRFFEEDKTHSVECDLCRNANRNMLIIVEKDIDLENIRKNGMGEASYFVLGNLLSPLEKKPSPARIAELKKRVEKEVAEGILKEIIIALSAHPDGDYTAREIQKTLSTLINTTPVSVTSLGRGISTGTEIEYSDPETIKHAFANRK